MATYEFRLLGPVSVLVDGRAADPPARPQQHLVLAVLLADAGRVVPVERLISRVWGADPPAQARRTLHTHVARLRRQLGDAVPLVRHDGGYRLDADPATVDLHRFRMLAEHARRAGDAPARPPVGEQADLWRAALKLWHGEAFAGLAGEWAARTRERLALERAEAEVAWAGAQISLGHAAEAVGRLSRVVDEHPLMEPAAAALIRALAASGRAAEALETYERTRQRLADELGTDPGSELSRLYRDLLDPPAAGVPAQIPAAVRDFVGRLDQIAQLDEFLDCASGTTVAVLSGMPGAGKSTLALHWAHRVRPRFPDGQLFVALRGFHPSEPPVDPGDALAGLLRSLGVRAEGIPAGIDERAALYRGLLADRQLLVVLDDAVSAEQVRPLLPGGSGCFVLVTSRNALSGLVAAEGAHPVPVEPFPVGDAIALLMGRLGDRRVAQAPAAVRDIAGFCAGLPLALVVAAAHALARPRVPLPVLAGELHAARDRFGALAVDDPALDVRTVFACSYRALSPAAARMFRLLGLHPGRDLGTAGVASLTGLPAEVAARTLAELARAHMVTEHRTGRWLLHDLLRAYAIESAETGEQDEALDRLLDHYLHSAYAADRLLDPGREPLDLGPPASGVTVADHPDEPAALAWFDEEWTALPKLVHQARDDRRAWRLAWALSTFIRRRAAWTDWVAVQEVAVAAAGRLGDQWALAHARRLLGLALMRLGRLDDARTSLSESLALFGGLNDPAGQALAHRGLGRIAYRRGSLDESLQHARQAVELYTDVGHEAGRANALNAVGWNLAAHGRLAEALPLCTESLAVQQRLGDRFGLASTWDSLGFINAKLGRLNEAIACYERSVALARELGDRHIEADTLVQVGAVYRTAGRVPEADRALRRAHDLLRTLDPLEAKRLGVRL